MALTLYDLHGLRIISLVSEAPLGHQVLPPAPLTRSNVLVAQRAPICLREWLPRHARLGLSVLSIEIDVYALTTPLALLVLILLHTFFDQMAVQ